MQVLNVGELYMVVTELNSENDRIVEKILELHSYLQNSFYRNVFIQ